MYMYYQTCIVREEVVVVVFRPTGIIDNNNNPFSRDGGLDGHVCDAAPTTIEAGNRLELLLWPCYLRPNGMKGGRMLDQERAVPAISAFLEAIVGTEGMIEIRQATGAQRFFDSPAEAAQAAYELAQSRERIWYGVAARAPGSTRGRASDCYTPKCFFADLDNFPVWNEEAVQELLSSVGLPDPSYVVASGGGHHLYWLYAGELERAVWAARESGVVSRLHTVTERGNFPFTVDKACKDVARVLQVPYLPNFKYDPERHSEVLESCSTEEVYSADLFRPFTPTENSSPQPEWWNYELPERLTGTGQRDASIIAFACRRLVRDNAPYHTVLSEARAFFCDPATCDPPVTFQEVRERVDRMNRINQENRRAYEAERQARAQEGNNEGIEQEDIEVQEIARHVIDQIRDVSRNVEGFGFMVYSREAGKYLGSPYSRLRVRSGMVSMAEQFPHHAEALRNYQTGSRFQAIYEEVQARALTVSAREVSSEPGIVPIQDGKVVNMADGSVEDRTRNPPFFTWKSPVSDNDYSEVRAKGDYGAWGEFIISSFPDHKEQTYLQRLMYYAAQGGNHQRVFIMAHGPSSAGKNLFFESVSNALQGEVICPPKNLVCKSIKDFDTTSQLRLSGYRLVFCDEINRGDHLDTSRVKALTSDAGVRARAAYAREDSHGSNSFVLALLTNVLPELDEPDEALMNRLHFISFRVARRHPHYAWRENDDRPLMDLTLKDRIKSSEVLAWIAAGAKGYEMFGVSPPATFLDEARSWFRKVDAVGSWADDMLEWRPGMQHKAKFADLHRDFQRDMATTMKLPQFKERLRDYFDRRGWAPDPCTIDRADGVKDVLYAGEVPF
jgi:phage/plasmid-associated DNA primase